jgi:H+/Cl- antiporter ClcA
MLNIKHFDDYNWQGSSLKFGSLDGNHYKIKFSVAISGSIVLGIIGGVLGATFLRVNFSINKIRKRVLKNKWMKPIETFLLCLLTSSIAYLVSF